MSGRIVVDGSIVEIFDLKVAPHNGAEYDDEALNEGNVSREEISNYPPMEEVFSQFIDMLNKYVNNTTRKINFSL